MGLVGQMGLGTWETLSQISPLLCSLACCWEAKYVISSSQQFQVTHRCREHLCGVEILGKVSKKYVFLGLCPKHRTPHTHHVRLGIKVKFILLFRLFGAFLIFGKKRQNSMFYLGLWTPTHLV